MSNHAVRRVGGAVLAALALGGCARVTPIDEAPKGPPLAPAERTIVREQVTKARGAKEWRAAWNQEVAAGADRGTLEMIAVEALEDEADGVEDMFVELRKKGPLGAEARRRVEGAVQREAGRDRWSQALDMAIVSAEDPPEFRAAWDVYRKAPPDEGPALLERLRKAREEHDAKASGTPR
jgi:hypothetical protein